MRCDFIYISIYYSFISAVLSDNQYDNTYTVYIQVLQVVYTAKNFNNIILTQINRYDIIDLK